MPAVRMAMIGGGRGAFIGPIHRIAAALDGEIRLVAGAFSSDSAISAETGQALGLPAERSYASYLALLDGELRLPPDKRAEFVSIVTPNRTHVPIALAALARGFAVFCEKPVAMDVAQSRMLQQAIAEAGQPFGVAYTYLGYPLVHEAAARVAAGQIGTVRRVHATYTQGWLAQAADPDNRQAQWRTDPASAGAAGALGDIGVHAQSLAEFVTGLPITEVSADLRSAVPFRPLDDDGAALLRFGSDARGLLVASQICVGDANRLELRVNGDLGSLEWVQERPSLLVLDRRGCPREHVTPHPDLLVSAEARALLRLPDGHPEGFLEALANLYRAFARRVRGDDAATVPGIAQGLRSMAFIEACLASSSSNGSWTPMAETGE